MIMISLSNPDSFSPQSNQMLSHGGQLPDLYPLWLLCNFVEEAVSKKVPLSAIRECLTIDITSFAVCIAIDSWEQILVSENDPHGRDFNLQRSATGFNLKIICSGASFQS